MVSGFVSITDRRFECSKVGVNGLAGLNFPRKQIFPWNARFGTTLEVCIGDTGKWILQGYRDAAHVLLRFGFVQSNKPKRLGIPF